MMRFQGSSAEIAYDITGQGPPLLLLHGFPQTRAMWDQIVPQLAPHFTVVTADLRGYGASSKPEGVAAYSFREMGRDMLELMAHLGHPRFALAGHDRGARTAHRMALDAPASITRVALLDIIPTHLLLNALTTAVATGYYHWFFLAQPAPFPETLIGHDPDHYFESCLTGWGSNTFADFAPSQLAAYRASWRNPATITAMCNDYRAAIKHDFALDAADLTRQLDIPALILYGKDGPMAKAYDVPATWANRFKNIKSQPMSGGHFFPDTAPDATAQALLSFLLP
jgi:haloacetate dehalogenase